MAEAFDPYRESLVMEQTTIWPDEFEEIEPAERTRTEQALHASPQDASELEYVRQHTGFCRQITVTALDLERVRGGK